MKSLSNLVLSKTSLSLKDYSSCEYRCIIYEMDENCNRPRVVYRQCGDDYILIEYGPMEFNLSNRIRVHYLIEELRHRNPIEGILEYSPGVRSLQIHYNSLILHQNQLISALISAEDRLTNDQNQFSVQSRIISLPLAFEDSSTLNAIQRYQQTIKQSAPWLPNNVDFIQRINGLSSREQVKQIVYSSSYLIVGLGDVYLGAPCAIPIDPRHRLMTSKYNPARTFTAEGTVGIGGIYMCIYGMDSPGGYQFIGRTLPIWNSFHQNKSFKDNKPWLLTFFDQVRFYPVTEDELLILRQDFKKGNFHVDIIEQNYFHLSDYNLFLKDNSQSIELFRHHQSLAFNREVSLWEKNDLDQQQQHKEQEDLSIDLQEETDGLRFVHPHICGSVWKILVQIDQVVQIDTPLLILEAMKMEIILPSPIEGTISAILCHLGQFVDTKHILFLIKPSQL